MNSQRAMKVYTLAGKHVGYIFNDKGTYKAITLNEKLLGFWDSSKNKSYNISGICIGEGVKPLETLIRTNAENEI